MPYYEKPNPVMDAIRGFRAVNDIFRQDRLDKEASEERKFQRDRQTKADAMAREEHDLRVQALRKKDDEDKLQAAKYYLTAAPPGTDPLETMPKEYREMFKPYIEQDPYVQRYLADPKFRTVQQVGLKDIEEGMSQQNGPPDMQRVIQGVNSVYGEELNKGMADDGQPAKSKVLNQVALSPDGKSFTGTVIVTRQDGSKYEAPLTEGRGSGEGDPIKWIPIQQISVMSKMRQGMIDYVNARLIEKGNTAVLAEQKEEKKKSQALSTVETAIKKLPPGPEKDALQAVLPSVAVGDIPAGVGDTMIKAAIPKEEEIDYKDYGYGQIMYTKGPKKGQIAKVPVKPERGRSGGGGEEAGGEGVQLFMTRNSLDQPPIIESVPIGSRAYKRYMSGDLAMSGRVIPVGKKKQMNQNQAYNALMGLNPVTQKEKTVKDSGATVTAVVPKYPQAKVAPQSVPQQAKATGQPDLATAQRLIKKYGSKEAAKAAWQRGER